MPGSRGPLAVNSSMARAQMVCDGAGAVTGSLRAAFELLAALYSPQLLGWTGLDRQYRLSFLPTPRG